jgi:HAD superfamily hydrolase (TIGR01509 family)
VLSAVLFDIDGTLVDSTDAHAQAWVKAFAESGITVDFNHVRRCIGMGGDKLMPAVSDLAEDSPEGKRISRRRGEIFKRELLPQVTAFQDADRLVAELRGRGYRMVAASSAKKDELQLLLKIARVDTLMDAATSSDDAEESKPDPDIIEAAMKLVQATPTEAVMIGDTPYDIEAARRGDIPTIAFRSGGWADRDLKGAIAIYDGPWDLLKNIDASPIGAQVPR